MDQGEGGGEGGVWRRDEMCVIVREENGGMSGGDGDDSDEVRILSGATKITTLFCCTNEYH